MSDLLPASDGLKLGFSGPPARRWDGSLLLNLPRYVTVPAARTIDITDQWLDAGYMDVVGQVHYVRPFIPAGKTFKLWVLSKTSQAENSSFKFGVLDSGYNVIAELGYDVHFAAYSTPPTITGENQAILCVYSNQSYVAAGGYMVFTVESG